MPPPSTDSGPTNDPERSQRISALKTIIENILTYDPEALKQFYPRCGFSQNSNRFQLWYRKEHLQFSQLTGKLLASLGKYEDVFEQVIIEETVFAEKHYVVNEWTADSASRVFELYVKDKDGQMVEKPVWSYTVKLPRMNEVKESFDRQGPACY
jgi:hypothetical protein